MHPASPDAPRITLTLVGTGEPLIRLENDCTALQPAWD
jgi:hypothetical protein